ncbi:MaoC/PaaZ C-terminal domain-containing protein [Nocardia sp. alder85J]|uniref:MaoC/PaaZ C-terminal domain-containing protein n=1 Tax=Nocardia sp. alder85J TaxID=2862949 RepID=UPI001CD4E819|nr:MaoC/PaaZ C-terminal domain-containing protein [Nocardia sp. alder85J]MCX4096844.1 MaoC/PaaZ C-terminal domain-containing protein [Nocardia sp. alder85J]
MPIDAARALSNPPREAKLTWRPDDVLLYHLALGAGAPPTDPAELAYATETGLRVLPSFAVVAPSLRTTAIPGLDWPGLDIELSRLLHGSQRIDVQGPLPVAAEAVAATRIAALHDKGKAAVIVLETVVRTTDGAPLWTETQRLFARGEGGFGGERGATTDAAVPDRAPDSVRSVATLPQQALWYRLLGDRNPLHSDPAAAAAAGFPRPILHGLCTYGIVLKTAVTGGLGGDVDRIRGYDAIFTGVVFPGETLTVSTWHTGASVIVTATVDDRDGAAALTAELTTEAS